MEAPARPNVVLIVLDTMRQDRMACYGYDKPTTPVLDQLAATARVFDRAYSTTSWTLPAHASIFTGQYPATHGATQEHWVLSESALTLAEVFRAEGYATAGIHANPILTAGAGYEQGFETYQSAWEQPYGTSPENKTLNLFRDTLAAQSPGKPFFLFVNVIEPHSPYDSARQFQDRFVTDPTQTIIRNMWAPYYIGEKTFTPAELQHLSERYDGEVLYADYMVGEMIRALQAHAAWENTIFVVTSDHGENFGDHGHYDHVFSLYEGTTRVPLILHYPAAVAPGRETHRVQVTDIFATLTDLCGITTEAALRGPGLLESPPPAARPIVMEYYYPRQTIEVYKDPAKRASPKLDPYRRRLRAIIQDGFKYIWADKGAEALYAIDADPKETNNLIDSPAHQATLATLRLALADWVTAHASAATTSPSSELPATPMRELDDDTVDALRSLGYLE